MKENTFTENELIGDFLRRKANNTPDTGNIVRLRSTDHSASLSLRDIILLSIEMRGSLAAILRRGRNVTDHNKSWVRALVSVLADAGMPFETWKNDISEEALAGLRRMKIDLQPEISCDCEDALIDAALERHPDWSRSGDDREYRGDENTPHDMDQLTDWFRRAHPDEARQIERFFDARRL